MKFCSQCGQKLMDEDVFCAACGARQKTIVNQAPAQPATTQTPAQEQIDSLKAKNLYEKRMEQYNSGLSYLKGANSIYSLSAARDIFEKLGDFKNSRELVAECEEKIQNFSKKSRKRKKAVGVLVTVISVAVVLTIVGFFVFYYGKTAKQKNDYQKACDYATDGEYSKAKKLYKSLGDYRNSKGLAEKMGMLEECEDYKKTVSDTCEWESGVCNYDEFTCTYDNIFNVNQVTIVCKFYLDFASEYDYYHSDVEGIVNLWTDVFESIRSECPQYYGEYDTTRGKLAVEYVVMVVKRYPVNDQYGETTYEANLLYMDGSGKISTNKY